MSSCFPRSAAAVVGAALLLPLLPAAPSAAATPEVLAVQVSGGVAVSSPPGTAPRLVVPHGREPDVSPDGTRLAWVARGADGRPHVFVGGIDGSSPRQVTSGAAADSRPDWSPDGTHLALERYTSAGTRLAVVRADGSQGRVLPAPSSGGAPSWSPDGRFLAYAGAGGVGVVDAAGRNAVSIPEEHAAWRSGAPAWSPRGDRLAVSTWSTGGDSGIDVLDLALGTRRSVAVGETPRITYGAPDWTPDGNAVYAHKTHDGGQFGETTSFVARHPVDGSEASVVSGGATEPSSGGGERVTPSPGAAGRVTQVTAEATTSRVLLSYSLPPGSAGVTVRYAPGTTPPAGPTDGLPGGESFGSTAVVDHLAPSTTYAFSVFTRHWNGDASPPATTTATTPADVATSLALTPSTTRAVYGQSVRLAARLVRKDTGRGVAGARITLLGNRRGEQPRVLQTLTTAADGSVATARIPAAETRYTLRYDGTAPLRPASATTVVHVAYRVAVSLSRTSVPRNGAVTATVRVAPSTPGLVVSVEQRRGSETVALTVTKLSSSSSAVVRLRTGVRGRYDVVVVTRAANGLGAGYARAALSVT